MCYGYGMRYNMYVAPSFELLCMFEDFSVSDCSKDVCGYNYCMRILWPKLALNEKNLKKNSSLCEFDIVKVNFPV